MGVPTVAQRKWIWLAFMRMWVWSLASLSGLGSGVAMSFGVDWKCGLDLALLWRWCRPAAVALIRPLGYHLQQHGWRLHTEWNKSEIERQTPYDITYMGTLKYGTNDLSTQQKRSWTWRTDLCLLGVGVGDGQGVGRIGSLGLVDENCCIWSGWAMGFCCIAQGTISNHLWWIRMEDRVRKRMYIYV